MIVIQALQETYKVLIQRRKILKLLCHSNFWRTINIPLINCEINLILTWAGNCVITSKVTRDADPDANPAVAVVNYPTNATFKTTDAKLYVPGVTLSTKDDKKLSEQLRTRFQKTIKWNKYRSEMTNHNQFHNILRLFDVLPNFPFTTSETMCVFTYKWKVLLIYFTWKLELVSDILWVIVSGNLFLILACPRPLQT